MAKKKAKRLRATAKRKKPARKAPKPARPTAKAKAKTRTGLKAKKARPVKARKPARSKKTAPAEAPFPWREALPGEKLVGVVEDYFSHVGVIALTLQESLRVGDRIHVRGHTTEISQSVQSMQVDHAAVEQAAAGVGVGVRIDGKARQGDYVYKAV